MEQQISQSPEVVSNSSSEKKPRSRFIVSFVIALACSFPLLIFAVGTFLCMFGHPLSVSRIYVNLVPGLDTVIQTKQLPKNFVVYPNVDDAEAYICSEYEPTTKKTTFALVRFSNVLQRFEFKTTGYASFNLSISLVQNQTTQ